MRISRLCALLTAASLFAPAAQAQIKAEDVQQALSMLKGETPVAVPLGGPAIMAADPQGMIDWFTAQGFVATLDKDGWGDPLIDVRFYGSQFSVFFYECTNNTQCGSIQFFAGYGLDDLGPSVMNDWNYNNRYLRAYLTEDAARIEYDVFTGAAGLDPADFSEVVSIWTDGLAEFEAMIGW